MTSDVVTSIILGSFFTIVGPPLLSFALAISPFVGLFYLAYRLNHCEKCANKEDH